MSPRVTKCCTGLYLVGLYEECPNYSPWVKFDRILGVTSFTVAYIYMYVGKTFEISLYLAMRPMAPRNSHMALSIVGLYQECPNYVPGVKIGPAQ